MSRIATITPEMKLSTPARPRDTASIAMLLQKSDIHIFDIFSNGRTVVFLVDAPPPFVRGVMTRRESTDAGGRERVMAAPFHGMQLQWRVHESSAQEQLHAR